ncbi:MAG TPA: RNA polymerase sigma factor [Urbifossiella sp.]|nr:RNA polymerase sigma factor [Urbifossiella sp.]
MSDKLTARIAPTLARCRAEGAPDDELVGRYVVGRDEDAFAELVRRHGAMVLAVCRRVVRNAADADDVFQATFLVLARKAGAIRPPGAVGPWLHGVAFRTARDAARRAARRREMERRVPPREPTPDPPAADVRPILDAELDRLPRRFAQVLVLSDMEGQSRGHVAALLRIPEGTVASRLARAREALAARLSRRGVDLAPGAVAALLAADVHAVVAAELVGAAARAGYAFGLGGVEGASPGAVSLANAALAPRLRFLLAGVVAAGVAVAGWAAATGTPHVPTRPRAATAPASVAQPAPDPATALRERVVGEWQVTDGAREGRPLTEWEKSGFQFHFNPSGTLTIHRGQVRGQRAFTWTIDAKASPPVLLWTPTGGGSDRTIRVPFGVRENELVLTWDEPEGDRGRRGPAVATTCRVTLSKTTAPAAGVPAVLPAARGVVGSRLAGAWESDPELNARLGRPGAAAARVTFTSDSAVAAEVPVTYRALFTGKTVHAAGRMTAGGVTCPFLLIEHHGDARLVLFVPSRGGEVACEESATASLVPGAAGDQDVLFLTAAGPSTFAPAGAFRRRPASTRGP